VIKRKIVYFEKAGPANTEATLALVKERAELLGIRHIVVASSTGTTALQAAKLLHSSVETIVGVTLSALRPGERKYTLLPEIAEEARALDVAFLTATHALMGTVDTAIGRKFGGIAPSDLISHVLYSFGQGMKVAVEVALMAGDAGLIPLDKEIIAVAGSTRGADTAIVVRPAPSRDFFQLRVREIICKPR